MRNEILEVAGSRWLVREAVSEQAALSAIASARVTGSVGHKNTINRTFVGGGIEVQADVHQINSDGTERQPYTEAY